MRRRPVRQSRGPTLEPGLESGIIGERLVAGLLLVGPGQAKPKQETRGHAPVGPPPARGTMRDRCKEDQAADKSGDLRTSGGQRQSWNPVVDTGSTGCHQVEEGVLLAVVGLWDS
ncbi:hypothetical protein CRENBAI_006308 [Crenichthys baileyi]|uniref:Uncharacterized protein n=1 Tax=Crenichthys baileyi TaxID=28760 RepID=A0AAV9S138_9TELE